MPRNGQLIGLRILAIENIMSSPFASMLLADLGAEVIKVEQPGSGDIGRQVGPFATTKSGKKISAFFIRNNRNKKSITLDLKKTEGQQIFKDLIKSADIFITNLTPTRIQQLSIEYEKLSAVNPRLIYTAISGFGHPHFTESPFFDRTAVDIIMQNMGGIADVIETDSENIPWLKFPIGDYYAALIACIATATALYDRMNSGKGSFIDIGMYDSMLLLNERALVAYSVCQEVTKRGGGHGAAEPWGAYKVKDGYISIGVVGEEMWKNFCRAIQREDIAEHPDFSPSTARIKNRENLNKIIEQWGAQKTKEEAMRDLFKYGVPAGPVQGVEDIFRCPQANARGMWAEMNDPALGKIKIIGNPIQMSNFHFTAEPAPALGEHTEDILKSLLGMEKAKIEELRKNRVI